MTWRDEIRAGAVLFGTVFAAGFMLGMIRESALRPSLGADLARLVELPVMVLISWQLACWVVRRKGPASGPAWWRVGALAFILLIGAEILLGLGLMRQSLAAIGRDLVTPVGLASFLAQSLLIVMPRLAAARS